MNLKLFNMLQHRASVLFSRSSIIAWIVFFISLGITFLLWSNAREDAMNKAHTRFKGSTVLLTQSIQNRMFAYENFLQSGAALLNTVEWMNRKKWHTYVESVHIAKSYPGFQGIGFAKVIRPDELSEHIRTMRADGFFDYRIKPEGKRSEYHVITYIEPLDKRNRRAVGYDMFSDPTRQKAMIRARDTAQTSLSGKVTLVQENGSNRQPGFLMYIPFYHMADIPKLQPQRREHLEGFVFAPFRAGDLMKEILFHKNPDIALRLYDGTVKEENLLYESSPRFNTKPLFEETTKIMMYGRIWSVVFQTPSSSDTTIDNGESQLIIFAGLPISFLLLLTILSFSQTTEQARKMARAMTKEIRALNEELETMISAVPSPIILHTEDGTIVKINQAWMEVTEYTHDELPTIDTLVKALYRDVAAQAEVRGHIQSLYSIIGKVDEGEFSFYSKSGRKITLQFSSAPFGLIDGKRAVITSAMDITELKNKDELMIMQSRHAAMGEMISMIAHQWRQPLSSIATIAGTLSLDVMMDEYKKEFFQEQLDSISDLAMDLSETINDFRNFFKKEKIKELTTWNKLVEESLTIIGPSLKAKNITLHFVCDENVSFMAYPRELKQVILNLIKNSEDVLVDNAILQPQIWIRTSYQDEKTCLEIEDNGGGIPMEIINKIFNPYFSTKMDKNGTGIGLYMSKTIIEQHSKGQLSIHNTEQGACFKIVLPVTNTINGAEGQLFTGVFTYQI